MDEQNLNLNSFANKLNQGYNASITTHEVELFVIDCGEFFCEMSWSLLNYLFRCFYANSESQFQTQTKLANYVVVMDSSQIAKPIQ